MNIDILETPQQLEHDCDELRLVGFDEDVIEYKRKIWKELDEARLDTELRCTICSAKQLKGSKCLFHVRDPTFGKRKHRRTAFG